MRSRDRAGVCLILRACGLVVDRRALGLALELDLRANLDLSAVRYVRSRGFDLLLGCGFNLVQRDRLLILRLVVTESGAVLCCIVVLQCCSVAGNDTLPLVSSIVLRDCVEPLFSLLLPDLPEIYFPLADLMA